MRYEVPTLFFADAFQNCFGGPYLLGSEATDAFALLRRERVGALRPPHTTL